MGESTGHKNLVVWRKGIDLVTEVYKITRSFPRFELYRGLAGQMQRAAVSVPSNISEGYARNSRAELHQFLGVARGSLAELETQVEIAKNLGYMDAEAASELLSKVAEVARLLTGLRAWSAGAGH